jgi:O-acetyl-ADP-ribose deacetylase (regulator of RNase III)
MPIVKTVKGDLIALFKEGKFDAIVHGCNCFHTMGAGIAARIAREFPEAIEADEKTPYGALGKLGSYSSVDTDHGIIYNAYTQFRPGREDKQRLYRSIETAFKQINSDVTGWLDFNIGIPKIGAGLARGDWQIIERLVNRSSARLQITLVEFE